MTSAERPDSLFTKADPIDVFVDTTRLEHIKIDMFDPEALEEMDKPVGMDSPLVRQMLYSTKHLDVALDEAKRAIPDAFKTNGELDIFKMVAGYHNAANKNGREYKLDDLTKVSIIGAGKPIGLSLHQRAQVKDGLLMAPRLYGDRAVSIDVVRESALMGYPKDYMDYNIRSALELVESVSEQSARWQRDVQQLINDWQSLPIRTVRGDKLAREVYGMLKRRIASGSTGRSDRGLVSRLRSTVEMGKIANELIAVAAELSNGDSAAIMTTSGTHCVFFLANPEGSFVGLCEMSDKLPTYIDGVPDYLYYAVVSAIGWRQMKVIPHHLDSLIRKAMQFGGFGKDAFTQLEIVHHPEFVTKLPHHYATGAISMEEVTLGVNSPNTRPILIK